MGHQSHRWSDGVWAVAREQHGIVTRAQLLMLGFSAEAIKHRMTSGRLHPQGRGVYAVGRPEVSDRGRWMAAVLACGPQAALSHRSAAALWQIIDWCPSRIEVSVRDGSARRRPGSIIHRRTKLAANEVTRRDGIPVTGPERTLIDIALQLSPGRLEAAINEADKRGLTDPDALRAAVELRAGQPGVAVLRELLDRSTFVLTASALERYFLPVARAAGLPAPQTGRVLNGFEVDFFWPGLRLVVETDGLRYHRTPAQQARDRLRDQAHTAAGLVPLRFTHSQVRFEAGYVRATLSRVAKRLSHDPQ